MPMGRYHRPIAAWPGDIALAPHLLGILYEGAVDVDVIFGEQITYTPQSNRKAVSRQVEKSIRSMLALKLRGR
jgi:1-acyl-sn-glycerol-3-phosphate acyltransferase